MSDFVFARETASVRVNNYPVTIKRGTVWHRTDPTVRAHPDCFTDNPVEVSTFPGWVPPSDDLVEATTAAPGERKSTRRGR
jgi:hypothetical protein